MASCTFIKPIKRLNHVSKNVSLLVYKYKGDTGSVSHYKSDFYMHLATGLLLIPQSWSAVLYPLQVWNQRNLKQRTFKIWSIQIESHHHTRTESLSVGDVRETHGEWVKTEKQTQAVTQHPQEPEPVRKNCNFRKPDCQETNHLADRLH